MPIYKQMTELTKCADWLTAAAGHDIQWVYFGDKQVFTVWGEYDGTLPAQYSANGSMLSDYRIYGSAGGVGDRASIVSDYINGAILYPDGNGKIESYNAMNLALCEVVQWQTYTVARFTAQAQIVVGFFSIKPVVGDTTYDGQVYIKIPATAAEYTFVAPISGYAAINSSAVVAPKRNIAVVEGSTAPAEYVPFGYAVPMSVSDGTTSTTTPIYIGDTPLGEDEYVDYGEQKIYRMSGGVLTPTDPPVPLPALPTVDGTNIVDYAGQSAAVPSKFVAKYRKEGY